VHWPARAEHRGERGGDAVVTFDGRAAGTPPAAWEDDGRWAELPVLRLPVGRVVVVAAHPDDETLGAGGLLHELAAAGRPADVVVVTDGAASHPGSATLAPGDLVRVRRDEVVRAVAVLSPDSVVTLLDFPDSQVREHRDEIAAALGAAIGSGPLAAVVAPWRGDGHRDHRVTGEVCAQIATERGARLLEYPIWMWHWADPDHPATPWQRMRVLPLGDRGVNRKRRATTEHATQTEPLSDAPQDVAPLHPRFLRHFERATEVFIEDGEVAAPPAAEFFDAAYARRDDPWRLASRWYEERKRDLTTAVLPERRFASGLEIGCSIGLLTERLGGRCDRLLATDLALAAVEQATARVAGHPGARVLRHDVRTGVPDGAFDLVVLSEVCYYLSRAELGRLAVRVLDHLAPDGVVVACHWRHPVAEHTMRGDDAHRVLTGALDLPGLAHYVDADVVIDVWRTRPASVAQREGLVP